MVDRKLNPYLAESVKLELTCGDNSNWQVLNFSSLTNDEINRALAPDEDTWASTPTEPTLICDAASSDLDIRLQVEGEESAEEHYTLRSTNDFKNDQVYVLFQYGMRGGVFSGKDACLDNSYPGHTEGAWLRDCYGGDGKASKSFAKKGYQFKFKVNNGAQEDEI